MKHLTEAQNPLPESQNLQTEPRNPVLNMPVELTAIVYRDLQGTLERSSKRERDSISPVPLYDEEENENKRQKKDEEEEKDPLYDEEDEENQPYGHSGSEYMSEEEGEAPGDNSENPASDDRTDAFEAKLEKLTLDHETFKLNYGTLKLDHETLKLNHEMLKLNYETLKLNHDILKPDCETLKVDHDTLKLDCEKLKLDHETLKVNHEMLKLNYETHKEKTEVSLRGLVGRVAQGTRATNWVFGRLRATTKRADAAAIVVKSLWRDLRKEEAMPRPTWSPTVVNVASFRNPDANPEYWAE